MSEWEDIGLEDQENQQPAASRWIIRNILQDNVLLQAANDEWQNSSLGRDYLSDLS